MLGLFNKASGKVDSGYDGPPLDPNWVRNRRGKFFRLIHLDTVAEGLSGISAVYVIWHSGVKPEWVYVGRTDNLANALDEAVENDDIMEFEKNGGLYVTWSPVLKDKQNGVVKFLHDSMRPVVENTAAGAIKDGPINVKPPSHREG